MNGYNTS